MSSPEFKSASPSESGVCPACGAGLTRLPTVDGNGFVLVCNECDFQELVSGDPEPTQKEPNSPSEKDAGRFRRLLAENRPPDPSEPWPEELLEDLPPEAREALEGQTSSPDAGSPAGDVPGHLKRTLMDYGFAVDEDARGLRLRSAGGLRRPGTGDLSATDVVRLASELGGAPPPPEERRTCPSCKAIVSRSAVRCSWCDAELPPLDPEN